MSISQSDAQSRDRLVFFTTDEGYLFPTLNAAIQVIQRPGVAKVADVAIFLVGLAAELAATVRSEFEVYGLIFFDLSPEEYSLANYSIFEEGHVPPSALARLVVAKHIPTQYDHLIYLDGDILIVGDILPLLNHTVETGKVLAATDANMLCSSRSGKYGSEFRLYAQALGVTNTDLYFNSGVMAFRRQTLAELGPTAITFMRRNTALCRFHDQSALNAIADTHREILHPSFNYAPLFHQLRSHLEPVIIHFCGRSKPWQTGCLLWQGRWFECYERLAEKHDFLYAFWDKGSDAPHATERGGRIKLFFQNYLQAQRLSRYLHNTDFKVVPAASGSSTGYTNKKSTPPYQKLKDS